MGEQVAAHELTVPLTVNLVSADEAAKAGIDAEVTEEVVVLRAAWAQEEARKQADQGDFEGAKRLLRGAAAELRSRAPGSPKADELRRQADEMEGYEGMMSPADFGPAMKKQMRYSSRDTQRRRPQRGTGES